MFRSMSMSMSMSMSAWAGRADDEGLLRSVIIAHGIPFLLATKLLIDGAFAEASEWAGMEQRPPKPGCTVMAPCHPLCGADSELAYVASVVATISVVLVDHS